MPISLLWLPNSTLNLMAFVLVLHVLKTAFGFIFINWFSVYYLLLCHFVCFIVYFIVHAAFLLIKLMMVVKMINLQTIILLKYYY